MDTNSTVEFFRSATLIYWGIAWTAAMLVVPGIAMGIFWWLEDRRRRQMPAALPAEERREPEIGRAA